MTLEARVAQKLRDNYSTSGLDQTDSVVDPLTRLTLRARLERDLASVDVGNKLVCGAGDHLELKYIYSVTTKVHDELSPSQDKPVPGQA